jgi:hypothetical protein
VKITNLLRPALILTISGCAHNGGPLVFVVTHTVGVDIQATSSTSASPGLTLGYKSVNLAAVPIQMAKDGGASLRGCYAVGQNGASIPRPCADGKRGTGDESTHTPTSTQRQPPSPSRTAMLLSDRDESLSTPSLIPAVFAPPPPAAQPSGETSNFAESVEDAYSVYASFGTGTKAGGSNLSVDIGEVFATGDAAVQLAEGVNYYSSRAGNAEIIKAAANCIQQLTAAKNAGVDMSKVPSCGSSGTNPAPTLTAISPNSGNAPAAGAAATTVSIKLTGTGFNESSKLNISGNAGVTVGVPKPSADGASMTVDLTIAPGAAKSPVNISVTNPGGGTSAALTFTVQ